MAGTRPDGRSADEMRPVEMNVGYQEYAEGSVLIGVGQTQVLCAATVEEDLPSWRKDRRQGWVTAEYAMLPRATRERTPRQASARDTEISQFIGRALRASVDLDLLGSRTIVVDCDALVADGGTRCAAVTGGCLALVLALERLVRDNKVPPTALRSPVAAVGVALLDGELLLDPCAEEDIRADVDSAIVLNADSLVVEVDVPAAQPFSRSDLERILDMAVPAIQQLTQMQLDLVAS